MLAKRWTAVLDQRVAERSSLPGLRVPYGFVEGYEYIGPAMGLHPRLKRPVRERMDECGVEVRMPSEDSEAPGVHEILRFVAESDGSDWLRMAEVIRKLAGSDSEIVHDRLPVDDPQVRQPDITAAREKLDWSPQTGIEEGLRATLEDFRRRARERGARG